MPRSGGTIRPTLTRILATVALLGIYAFGMSGAMLTAGVSPAMAQRGRGRGRGWGRGRGRGSGDAAAIGAGIAAGIIGSAIVADQARRRAAEEDAIRYCMQRFRSYNPETGTYFTYRGEERPCP